MADNDVNNRTLSALLIVAILVSMAGTFVLLQKISQLDENQRVLNSRINDLKTQQDFLIEDFSRDIQPLEWNSTYETTICEIPDMQLTCVQVERIE